METIGVSNTFWKDVTEALEKEWDQKNLCFISVIIITDRVTNVYDESNSPEVLALHEELKQKIILLATKDAVQIWLL